MIFLFRLLLLLPAPLVLADSSSNAVNERIPVRKAEMEVHWKVDCAGSWATFVELRDRAAGEACTMPAELQRQLQLCAFIYQPPGEEVTHSYPDYRAATGTGGGEGLCQQAGGREK